MSYYSVTKIHNDINKDHLKIKFNNMEETSDYINITIKNVLNSNWKFVPINILKEIQKISPNNYFGEIIKLLMRYSIYLNGFGKLLLRPHEIGQTPKWGLHLSSQLYSPWT